MSEPLIPGGCILLARKIIESEIWGKPPLYIKVWIYLLTRAQHSSYKGLKRGQVLTSIPEIIEGVAWKVGARIERPTKDQVFQVLEFLRGKAMKSKRNPDESNESETMITTTKATHSLLVTIDNYAIYQDFKSYESNDESDDETVSKATRKQRRPDNINKNVKNVNKDLKISSRQPKTYAEDSSPYRMAVYLHNKIMDFAEALSVKHLVENADMQKWADDCRKILELDRRDKEEVLRVINWATSHHFWQKNILSPKKLREQFGKLGIEMAAESKSNPNGQSASEKLAEKNRIEKEKIKEMLANGSGGNKTAVLDYP